MSKKAFLVVLGIFVLGMIIGYNIHQFFSVELDPFLRNIVTVSTFIAVATLVVTLVPKIVPIILTLQKKKEEETLRQDELILNDLRNWESKTTFSNIKYDWAKMKIEAVDHKDPSRSDLPFFDEDINVLKKYNAFTSWDNGKKISEKLKEDGVKALREFHEIVDGRLENIPLKRSLTRATLKEYYSVPYIREIIIRVINGQHIEITLEQENNFLRADGFARGDVVVGASDARFANGNTEVRNSLKKIIEDLMQDTNVKKQIEIYDRAKNQLKERKHFSEFRSKFKKIFNGFKWHGKLKR